MTTPSAAARQKVGLVWNAETITVVLGLTLGWVLGFAGGMVQAGMARDALWAVSSMGIMAAAAVLAVRYASTHVMFAAGLVLLAIGEGVIHAQGPSGIDAFASATFAYFPGLLLVALSSWGPSLTRLTALGAALAFGAHAIGYLAGSEAGPDGILASIGYGLLGLTMIGWTWQVLRPSALPNA